MGKSIVQTATLKKSTRFNGFQGYGLRAILSLILGMMLSACTGERPEGLGINKDRLKPCPYSPNCVSTNSGEDRKHFIKPILFSGNSKEVMGRVRREVKSQERTRIIEENDHYLYAEFESRVFGFVDDVEFYFEGKTGTLHARSASRMGYGDLGVNRERIELLFSLLEKTDKKPST